MGVSKKLMDICPHGVGLMGYGLASQKVEGGQHPIHARVFVLRNSRTKQEIAYVFI
ncbi:MAG: hypothetical protein VYA34_14695 [Myxococcota bacterium]|nr:hypothetical protein [Myxococcota bacterium]